MKTCLTLAIAALALTGSTVKSADPDPCEAIGYLAPTPLYQGVGPCPEHERDDIKKGILRLIGMNETISGEGLLLTPVVADNAYSVKNLDVIVTALHNLAGDEAALGSKRFRNDLSDYGAAVLQTDLTDMSNAEGSERTIVFRTTDDGIYAKLTDRGWESFVISGREQAGREKVMWKMAYDTYTNNGDTKYFNLYNYAYATGGWRTHPEYYRIFIIGDLFREGYINFDFPNNSANPNDDERVVTLTDKGHIWFANNIGGANLVGNGTRWDFRWLTPNHHNFGVGIVGLRALRQKGVTEFSFSTFLSAHPFNDHSLNSSELKEIRDGFDYIIDAGGGSLVTDNGNLHLNVYALTSYVDEFIEWQSDDN